MGTNRTDQLSVAVVEAVADREGVDPVDLDTSLYEVVDPDALDELFAADAETESPDGWVTFSFAGYEVTAYSDGEIAVRDRD